MIVSLRVPLTAEQEAVLMKRYWASAGHDVPVDLAQDLRATLVREELQLILAHALEREGVAWKPVNCRLGHRAKQ